LNETKILGRTPSEWVLNAQVHLLFKRRGLRFIEKEQQEWDDLTEAALVLNRCLKKLEGK
jgi:hypothetical protein